MRDLPYHLDLTIDLDNISVPINQFMQPYRLISYYGRPVSYTIRRENEKTSLWKLVEMVVEHDQVTHKISPEISKNIKESLKFLKKISINFEKYDKQHLPYLIEIIQLIPETIQELCFILHDNYRKEKIIVQGKECIVEDYLKEFIYNLAKKNISPNFVIGLKIMIKVI